MKALQAWDIGAKDDFDRKNFYRELIVFIEKRHQGPLPASSDPQLVHAVATLKEYLPLDAT
jgi:hypothetical protein